MIKKIKFLSFKEIVFLLNKRKVVNYGASFCNFKRSSKSSTMPHVLNVAEKNDAAKNIADIMSNGRFKRRNGRSVYNKIYEYEYNLFNQRCYMVMTSVSGHLLNLEFAGAYKNWQLCDPIALFEAPIISECLQNYQPIKLTLENEIRKCQHLVIWTDGDREGENIGFEIIEVCKKVKPNIQVYRARFSEITRPAIIRACENFVQPDTCMNDAVNIRKELDLRIGAAFTRFQTMRLTKVFPEILANQVISYGSCQFPTLGFVVERYKQVQSFISEKFWKLKVTHKKEDTVTEFSWKRGRLFDHTACLVFYHLCLESSTAQVVKLRSQNKNKWRPQPLDTVEFEKLASIKLRINAKEAMNIAEKLYTKGFISYPRTETTIFPKELDIVSLVEMQCNDSEWGGFASRVLMWGPDPRQGSKTDNAHPPIHPTKYTDSLQGKEKSVYELVVRHFLACVSKDAEGRETTIEIDINSEMFAVNGLMIIERHYLEVYPYERWNAKVIGEYVLNEIFQPSCIEMIDGKTSPPNLLTEADLIGLMEKHGIGTDATHAEHIERIKSRLYVGVNENGRFVPGELGMGLVEGYDLMGLHISKPHLRAGLETDLKRITEGTRDPKVVLKEQIQKYKQYFIEVVRQAIKLDNALANYFNVSPEQTAEERCTSLQNPIMKCPKCQSGDIVLRTKKANDGFFFSCMSYPVCNAVMWLPDYVKEIICTDELCSECQPTAVKKLRLKVKPGSLSPFYPDEFEACFGGCNSELMNTLGVHSISASRDITVNSLRSTASDSGYESYHSHSQSNNSSTLTSSLRSHTPSSRLQSNETSNGYHKPPNNPVSVKRNIKKNVADEVLCNCGKVASVLTVRKEGPNIGRKFYKCPELSDATKCNFFLWSDEITPQRRQVTLSANRNENNSLFEMPVGNIEIENSSSVLQCGCKANAKLMTVKKEGINKGRQFYTCGQGQGGCGFFKWADQSLPLLNDVQSTISSTSGSFRSRSLHLGSSEQSSSKRKCGICSQRGHNRKSCPQR